MNAHLYNVRKILKINFLCILFGPILLYRRRSFLPKNQKWTITASLSQQEEKVKSKKKKWCCYWSSSDVRLRGGRYKVETPANNSQSAASQGNRKKNWSNKRNIINIRCDGFYSALPLLIAFIQMLCLAGWTWTLNVSFAKMLQKFQFLFPLPSEHR